MFNQFFDRECLNGTLAINPVKSTLSTSFLSIAFAPANGYFHLGHAGSMCFALDVVLKLSASSSCVYLSYALVATSRYIMLASAC